MFTTLILFAQEEAKKDGIGALLGNPIILLPIIFMAFYFIVILPQQRRQRKEQNSMMSGLKKNDEVITAAGIIGIVAHIKENGDEVTLKIDDNARIRVLKSSIVRIVKKEDAKESAASAGAAANTNIKPT